VSLNASLSASPAEHERSSKVMLAIMQLVDDKDHRKEAIYFLENVPIFPLLAEGQRQRQRQRE
jgi:hypothetical protein